MPIICSFRGIRITINYKDHMPPHFHAYYGEYECCVDIKEIEKINGGIKYSGCYENNLFAHPAIVSHFQYKENKILFLLEPSVPLGTQE